MTQPPGGGEDGGGGGSSFSGGPLTGASAASSSSRVTINRTDHDRDDYGLRIMTTGCSSSSSPGRSATSSSGASHRRRRDLVFGRKNKRPPTPTTSRPNASALSPSSGTTVLQQNLATIHPRWRKTSQQKTSTIMSSSAKVKRKRRRLLAVNPLFRRPTTAGAFFLLGAATSGGVYGLDEKMARWLEDNIATPVLNGEKNGDIISPEEFEKRRRLQDEKSGDNLPSTGLLASTSSSSKAASRMFRAGDAVDEQDAEEEELERHQFLPLGMAPDTPPDRVADARRYLVMEAERERTGWKYAEEWSKYSGKERTKALSSSFSRTSSRALAATDDEHQINAEKNNVMKHAYGHSAVTKNVQFFTESDQWKPDSLHNRAVHAQQRNLLHADNPNFPKALTRGEKPMIITPTTDYERLVQHEQGKKKPSKFFLHDHSEKSVGARKLRKLAEQRHREHLSSVDNYLTKEDPKLVSLWEKKKSNYNPFTAEESHLRRTSELEAQSVRKNSEHQVDDPCAGAAEREQQVDFESDKLLLDKKHADQHARKRLRQLKASTAFLEGGYKAVEEDLQSLPLDEQANFRANLQELEDIAEELEENNVLHEISDNDGEHNFESVGLNGKNELSVIENSEEEQKMQIVRDLRRALKDQRAGMKVVDVVARLRKKHENRRRRRLEEIEQNQILKINAGDKNKSSNAGMKCSAEGSKGASSLSAEKDHIRNLVAAAKDADLAQQDEFHKRSLSSHVTGTFFVVQPRAIAGFYDGRDEYCKQWTESPPVVSRLNPQFPRDGTGIMEQQNKACGVGIINYFFTTSDVDTYASNPSIQQVVSITLKWATFVISETCENLLDASGGLAIASCRFQANEAKFFLSQGLKKNTAYTLAVRHYNPETIVRANVANAAGLNAVAATLDSRGFVINTGAQTEVLRIGEPNDPGAINVRQYERIDVRKGSLAGVNITNPDIATAVRGLVVPASLHFSHQYLAVENTFSLIVKFHQGDNIEQPTQPQPLQFIKHNAKHPAADTENAQQQLNIQWEWDDVLVNLGSGGTPAGNRPNQNIRGYVNGFSWRPSAEYDSRQGTTGILFTFGFRFYGTLRAPQGRAIFLSQPSHVWEVATLSTDGGATECVGVQYNPGVGLKCNTFKYPGYQGNNFANGIFFFYDSAATVAIDTKISLRLNNPNVAVNMFWLAYSYQYMNGIMRAPFTMELDKPIATQGYGSGDVISTTSLAVNEKNKVTLLFRPGNTVIPMSSVLISGYLVILPPTGFQVDRTAAPSSVAGYNTLPCSEWPDADQQQNRWLCNLRDMALFRDAQYAVQLGVINPPQPMINTAWRVEVWQLDRSKPLATTREIRGISISGTMVASFEPFNQVLGNTNKITFKFQPSRDVTIAANATFAITAPAGFQISKRCAGFERGTLPADTVCKGTDDVEARLRFPGQNAIKGGELYEFKLDVINPSQNLLNTPNVWRFDTVRPDGIVSDTTNYPGFFLYPSEFASFTVVPSSRLAGVTRLDVRFVSKVGIATGSYIRIMAPIGIKWHRTNPAFSTASSVTGTNSMSTESPVIGSSSATDNTLDNMLLLRLTQNLFADFEYGVAHNILVPALTPIPNRYWIDTYVETGDPTAGDFDYIASLGAPGFRTQALFNTEVNAYNNVELAWNNPTTIQFETTTAVTSILSEQGTVLKQAELYIQAPPGFTFICPTGGWNPPTQVIPDGFTKLPTDAECYINHQVAEERRVVHILFKTVGLAMNTKYIFLVEIVNAASVNPTTNKFVLESRFDNVKVEGITIDGYDLAKPMANTRYAAAGMLDTGEDRTVDAYDNQVSFVMGVTQRMIASSVVEVGGPTGFLFSPRCIGHVGWAQKFASAETLVFPDVTECVSMAATTGEGNKIRITVATAMEIGAYPFFVKVQNPNFNIPTEKNYWTIRIYEPGSSVATMAEAWVVGFDIQVVKDVEVFPYNPGNGIPGEAAPNPLDIRFKLTTRLPSVSEEANGALILVVPPFGFHFPSVCRTFMTDPYAGDATSPYMAIPSTTICNPPDLYTPELINLYYRLGHPNFYLEFGQTETAISDDIRWEIYFREEPPGTITRMFRVRSVPAGGPAYARLVRAGYILESMTCFPEATGANGVTRQEDCLNAGKNFAALVESNCGTIDGQVALGATPAIHEAFLNKFADREVALDQISDCIAQKVWKIHFDELLVPVEMRLSGPALILKLGENTHMVAEQLYAFRVMVENPMQTFDNVHDLTRWWTIETRTMPKPSVNKRSQIKDRLDLNYKVHSFAVYPRISLFQLQTLNYIGQSETDVKISFDIISDLAPQATILITAPTEFQFRVWRGENSLTFGDPPLPSYPWNPPRDGSTGLFLNVLPDGTAHRPCISPSISAADYQVMDQLFPRSAIKDITRLPEYVSCVVINAYQIMITNTEPVRGGRTLMAGPVYEFLIDEVVNPPRTPFTASNLWRIVANTTTALGQEVWATEGWVIFPELAITRISSDNPANGLFTTFTIQVGVLTTVPGQGSILLRAPRDDFYFGPRLAFDGPPPDLLNPIPRASGGSPPRPAKGGPDLPCTIEAPQPQGNLQFICPITKTPCEEKARLEALDLGRSAKDQLYAQEIQALEFPCQQVTADCASRRYDKLFSCKYRTILKEQVMTPAELQANQDLVTAWNSANTKQLTWEPFEAQLEITLATDISMKQDQVLTFLLTGYNTLYRNFTAWQNEFTFSTRNADSGKTTLDERKGVPGFKLFGVVYVSKIDAQETKVSNTYNRVEITFRLTNPVKQRGLIRIQYPTKFELPPQSGGGAGTNTIDVSETVPRKAKRSQRGNIIELDSEDEDFPAGLDMMITITLSNPDISPGPSENIWIFETFEVSPQAPTGTTPPASALTMIDLNRDVQGFRIYGAFRSTNVISTIDSPTVVNKVAVTFVLESDLRFDPTARLQIYMPVGFMPVELCGDWSRSYQDGNLVYTEIPRGTSCRAISDPLEPAIELRPGAVIQYGLDYAFQFEVINAAYITDENNWRFQTMLNNVVLHLDRNVFGFSLQELQDISVQPYDTTRSVMGRLAVQMRSTKLITGASDIVITAPIGFKPLNTLFTILNIPGGHTLASTTTSTKDNNKVTFTLDSQDRVEPNLMFGVEVWITNPEFTPADNVWKFEITDQAKNFIDIKQQYPGYDITGAMFTDVKAGFPTKSRANVIEVIFVPTTIMNQADFENIFFLKGPAGYRFPQVCNPEIFDLKYTNPMELETSSMGQQAKDTVFPPDNLQCIGSGNETVTIKFPRGSGLLVFNYTLTLEVMNAAEDHVENIWHFETRKKGSSAETAYTIVDANRTIPGFRLQDLELAPEEAGYASGRFGVSVWNTIVPLLSALLLVMLSSGGTFFGGRLGEDQQGTRAGRGRRR
ncbi:unnamed protein product [Amoebophrya sp. A120]|nr:unnamed protein product [Amoebophrya sp. A120]|eukprot:GSA120T00009437001.1